MSLVEIIINLIWTIELSLRQFFSVFARLVDYKSLISIGELLVVVWAIGWMNRVGVKPKKIEIESMVKKTIRNEYFFFNYHHFHSTQPTFTHSVRFIS